MLNSTANNQGPLRPRVFPVKARPRLSLSLHTMPQTGSSHFLKWLLLALLIFCFLALLAFFAFWH